MNKAVQEHIQKLKDQNKYYKIMIKHHTEKMEKNLQLIKILEEK